MNKAAKITLFYIIFATIATAANLGVSSIKRLGLQWPYSIPISIFIGTATGLPIKYILEKKYIFEFESDSIKHDGKLFILYSGMGVFTTAIFWGVEYAFHLLFNSDSMRYLGGAIGLSIGYFIKYWLDKKFVFIKAAQA
ncbi:GtrA family protein [Marinomonas sp. GJ51-6]|uniref:GtrA family protein n=1 Tax=Marinomonas sp. GJ51-6 TaxID=2992802 RepID=UPI002934395E|nr:GtrA family protein [Marinomonas sp. GJ51-6]WOD07040.1 GtrA family protein [Marinomonas sp. GJ51-6]